MDAHDARSTGAAAEVPHWAVLGAAGTAEGDGTAEGGSSASQSPPSPAMSEGVGAADVHIFLSVEFDRECLRADFYVAGQVLPVFFPLRSLMSWVVSVWVGEDTQSTTAQLLLRLTNGRRFRVNAVAPAEGVRPVLEFISCDPRPPGFPVGV
jgi:hypothetical protein